MICISTTSRKTAGLSQRSLTLLPHAALTRYPNYMDLLASFGVHTANISAHTDIYIAFLSLCAPDRLSSELSMRKPFSSRPGYILVLKAEIRSVSSINEKADVHIRFTILFLTLEHHFAQKSLANYVILHLDYKGSDDFHADQGKL